MTHLFCSLVSQMSSCDKPTMTMKNEVTFLTFILVWGLLICSNICSLCRYGFSDLLKCTSTRHVSVTVITPLTLLLQNRPLNLPLVKVHLYLLSAPLLCGCLVLSLVFPNIEILNLIMGMCFIICVNKGPSHPIPNPFLTIISL